jgi:hypothetical protein
MAKSIPSSLQALLARELARGERVVWLAQPAPVARVLASASTFLVGIPFLAFALFWTWAATGGFASPWTAYSIVFTRFAYLWGGMFIVSGAAMLLSPVWAWWVARRTLYAVTDRRAIVIEMPLRQVTIRTFAGEQLATATRRENPSGRGDLIFDREASNGRRGQTVYRDIGFFGIEDVTAVQALLPMEASVLRAVL